MRIRPATQLQAAGKRTVLRRVVKRGKSAPCGSGATAESLLPHSLSHPMRALSPVLMAMLLLAPQIRVGASQAPIEGSRRWMAGAPASGTPPNTGPAFDTPGPNGPAFSIFLPLVLRNYSQPLLFGVYTPGWLALESTYTGELTPLDAFAGKHHTLVGTFVDLITPNYGNYVTAQLTMAWDHGYTPFVNLNACTSVSPPSECGNQTALAHIAAGDWDSYLDQWIAAFKTYAEGGGGRAVFIAPFQEMNYLTQYYNPDPQYFKDAFAYVRSAFEAAGVPAGSVRWVFAPNAYSPPADPFEEYYPGEALVDVVGLSTYNMGYTPGNSRWDPPSYTFGNYLLRLRTMAPAKPIIFTQTGTTATTETGRDDDAKNQWLTEAFNYLATQSQVRGFIYYNMCPSWEGIDWGVHDRCWGGPPPIDSLADYTGYQTGSANPAYRYITPADLKNMPLLP